MTDTMEPITPRDFQEAEGVEDWRHEMESHRLPWTSREYRRLARFLPAPPVDRWEFRHDALI